jgi:hypothetical protein
MSPRPAAIGLLADHRETPGPASMFLNSRRRVAAGQLRPSSKRRAIIWTCREQLEYRPSCTQGSGECIGHMAAM